MARRKKKLSPSLFPFLSVLITIIGILIFMTLALSMTTMDIPLIVESAVESITGSGDMRDPVILECKDNRAFIIKNIMGKAVLAQEFNTTDTWNHVAEIYKKGEENNPDSWAIDPFLEFLNKLSKNKSRFLLFLIRPSGIYTYTLLSDIVKMRQDVNPGSDNNDKAEEKPDITQWQQEWNLDWSIIYQEENKRVIPPA